MRSIEVRTVAVSFDGLSSTVSAGSSPTKRTSPDLKDVLDCEVLLIVRRCLLRDFGDDRARRVHIELREQRLDVILPDAQLAIFQVARGY
jgi:hypothetical protein